MSTPGKVLIAAPVHAVLIDGLAAAGYECVIQEKITQETAYPLVSDCVGIITSTRLQLDRDLLDAAPRLQWIGRMGSGMEVIDLAYAGQKDIVCFSSPEGNSNAVAEHALGMLLSLNKRIVVSHQQVAGGQWLREENRGTELEGKTIGIIGFGHTGRAFAKKLQCMDMNILVYDKYCRDDIPAYVSCCETLSEIFDHAEIVSFHVPLQADTANYFDEGFIARMRKPFVLINTSRGKVVDGKALLQGINDKKVTAACLDVWEEEPLERMTTLSRSTLEKLLEMPQIIVTPHIAGYSMESLFKMSQVLLHRIVKKD